jgi:hypothetical protein
MGAANPFARVKKIKVAQRETKSAITAAIQERRRNSHAYYVKKYVDLKGADPTDLLREVETVEKAKLGPQSKKVTIKKVPKFTRIGNKVLHGNFRELKTQIVMHINTINHRYKDAAHLNSTLLHFVCQEGSSHTICLLRRSLETPHSNTTVFLFLTPFTCTSPF